MNSQLTQVGEDKMVYLKEKGDRERKVEELDAQAKAAQHAVDNRDRVVHMYDRCKALMEEMLENMDKKEEMLDLRKRLDQKTSEHGAGGTQERLTAANDEVNRLLQKMARNKGSIDQLLQHQLPAVACDCRARSSGRLLIATRSPALRPAVMTACVPLPPYVTGRVTGRATKPLLVFTNTRATPSSCTSAAEGTDTAPCGAGA
jgi:hypothetical protein